MKQKNIFTNIVLLTFLIYIISIYIYSNEVTTVIISETILLLLMGLIIVYMLKTNKFRVASYLFFIGIFVLYSWLTCIWALDITLAYERSKTLTLLYIMSIVFYNFFYYSKKIEFIIVSFYISGIFLSLYTLFYYGIYDFFRRLSLGQRVGEEILNVNSLGMYVGISVIISIYFAIIYQKKHFYVLGILPLLIAFGTGSRKALIMILIGIIILYIVNASSKNIIKNTFGFIISFSALYFILKLPIFSSLNQRIQSISNLFTGSGEVDGSLELRTNMLVVGLEQLRNNPILGVGMDNARIISLNSLGEYTYLHNNYIELIVNGGLLGIIIFYSMYIYIFSKLLPFLKNKNQLAIITFTILSIRLVMDLASVSYYTKITYVYIILGFLVVDYLKNQKKVEC